MPLGCALAHASTASNGIRTDHASKISGRQAVASNHLADKLVNQPDKGPPIPWLQSLNCRTEDLPVDVPAKHFLGVAILAKRSDVFVQIAENIFPLASGDKQMQSVQNAIRRRHPISLFTAPTDRDGKNPKLPCEPPFASGNL